MLAKQLPQQSGFTAGRSTLDHIIALRLLAERRHEYRQPFYAAYIDLRIAFDPLDRNSLWNILKTIGVPPKLVDIIKTLYSSTHSFVRVNGNISEASSITSGVRQGCVVAANLFNTTTDRILNNTTQALTLGVNYDDSGQLITDLDYADNVVIFADLFDTLNMPCLYCQGRPKRVQRRTRLYGFSRHLIIGCQIQPWVQKADAIRITRRSCSAHSA